MGCGGRQVVHRAGFHRLSPMRALMDRELAGTPFRPLRPHRIYRLFVERDGDRVRLITRGGYDWTKRYPWIVEAELKNRQKAVCDRWRSRHPGRRDLGLQCLAFRQ